MNPLQGSKAQPLEIDEEDVPLRAWKPPAVPLNPKDFMTHSDYRKAAFGPSQVKPSHANALAAASYLSVLPPPAVVAAIGPKGPYVIHVPEPPKDAPARKPHDEMNPSDESFDKQLLLGRQIDGFPASSSFLSMQDMALAQIRAAIKPKPAEVKPKPVAGYSPLEKHWASLRLNAEKPYPPPPAAASSSAAAAASTPKPVPEAAAPPSPSVRDFKSEFDKVAFMSLEIDAYHLMPTFQPIANVEYWHARREQKKSAAAAASSAAAASTPKPKPKGERKPRKRKAEEELVAPPSSGVDVDTSDPKDIGSSLECGICLGLLYRPLVMKCKHSVCYVCYLDLVKHKGEDKIVCPMKCKPGRDLPPESLVLNDVIRTFLEHSGRFTPAQIAARKLEEAHWDKVITKGLKKQRHSRAAAVIAAPSE